MLPWVSRHRKLLVFLAFCIAVASPLYWYWQPLRHRVLWLYWSHRAAAFQMPEPAADAIISDVPRIVNVLNTNPDYYRPPTPLIRDYRPQLAQYAPQSYRQLMLLDPRLGITGGPGVAVLFMGTLHRPDGTRRLVIVTGGDGLSRNLLVKTYVLVLSLPSWTDPLPQTGFLSSGSDARISSGPLVRTQLKTTVPDAHDPSHVIFEFTAGNPGGNPSSGGGIIDAHLQNDDSLAFKLRSTWGEVPRASVGDRSVIPGDVATLQAEAQAQAKARRDRAATTGASATTSPASAQRSGTNS